MVEVVEPALHEESPLQPKGCDQEVKAHGAETVTFQEGHEETKANKDHDVDILEAWRHHDQTLALMCQHVKERCAVLHKQNINN